MTSKIKTKTTHIVGVTGANGPGGEMGVRDKSESLRRVMETCLIAPEASKFYALVRESATVPANTVRLLGTILDDEMASWFTEMGDTDGFMSPKMLRGLVEAADEGYTLEINSPGGDVFAGAEMMAILSENKPGKVVVTGIAASMAAMLALSSDTIELASPLSMMMFHAPSGVFQGNAAALQKNVNMLLEVENSFLTLIESRLPDKAVEAIKATFVSGDDLFLTAESLDKLGITGEAPVKIVAEFPDRLRLMQMQVGLQAIH